MKPKYWTIIILAALTIASGTIYYIKQPSLDLGLITVRHQIKPQFPATSAPTIDLKDWKTYTNSQYGFEFQYPSDWKDANRAIDATDFFTASLQIDVLDLDVLKERGSAKEVANARIKKNNCPGTVDSIGDHLIYATDKDALYALYCSATSENYVYIIQSSPNAFIQMSYHDDFSTDWTESNKLVTFNQIRSTFKFTTVTTSAATTNTDTSGWKTYTNSQYGFNFQYPSSWTYELYQGNYISFFPPGKSPDPSLEYSGDISVNVIDNPRQLDLKTFEQSQNNNLFAESSSQAPLIINGFPAEKFFAVYGMVPTNVYLINKGKIIIELNDIGQMHADDGIADQMAKSIK